MNKSRSTAILLAVIFGPIGLMYIAFEEFAVNIIIWFLGFMILLIGTQGMDYVVMAFGGTVWTLSYIWGIKAALNLPNKH